MEQEKLNLLYQQIRIRRSDFEKRINQLIISKNLAVITSDLRLYYCPYFMGILTELRDLEFFLVKS